MSERAPKPKSAAALAEANDGERAYARKVLAARDKAPKPVRVTSGGEGSTVALDIADASGLGYLQAMANFGSTSEHFAIWGIERVFNATTEGVAATNAILAGVSDMQPADLAKLRADLADRGAGEGTILPGGGGLGRSRPHRFFVSSARFAGFQGLAAHRSSSGRRRAKDQKPAKHPIVVPSA